MIEIWQPCDKYMRETLSYGVASRPDAAAIARMIAGEVYRRVITVDADDIEEAWRAGEMREVGWPPSVRAAAVGDVYARLDESRRDWYVVGPFGFDPLDVGYGMHQKGDL